MGTQTGQPKRLPHFFGFRYYRRRLTDVITF
jgi:hypothetical protein